MPAALPETSSLPRVLVVDDSPTIRRVVSNVLLGAGHAVVAADSGAQGLIEARAALPDLVLLDFMMPGMNGYQFIQALDEDERLAAVPVVLMCTRSDQVNDAALKQMGVLDTITKPFSPEAILAVTSWALAKRGLQKHDEATGVTDTRAPAFLSSDRDVDAASDTAEGAPPQGGDGDIADALARLLADALAARGIDDPDQMARAVTGEVAASLSTVALQELVARALGPEALRRPVPSLYGDLSAVPLPEVLQLLKFQGQTGVLELTLEAQPVPARMEIAFSGGAVVAVRARNVRGDLLLGRYFVAHGYVTAAQLEELLRGHDGRRPLGQRLLDAGIVDADAVRACLGEQAKDLMYELLRARRGVFGLRCGIEHVPVPHVTPGFSVDALLFEGLRRIDEWSVVEKEVPSFAARFRQVEGADTRGLTSEEAEVFGGLPKHGSLSVFELVASSRLRAYDVCQLLYRLVVMKRAARVEDGRAALVDDDVSEHV